MKHPGRPLTAEIEDLVISIVADHFGLPAPALSTKSQIVDECGADLFDAWELLMTVEELFSVRITDKAVEDIYMIEDIVNSIAQTSLTVDDLARVRHLWRIASRADSSA